MPSQFKQALVRAYSGLVHAVHTGQDYNDLQLLLHCVRDSSLTVTATITRLYALSCTLCLQALQDLGVMLNLIIIS